MKAGIVGDLISAVEIGAEVRVGVCIPDGDAYRLLTIGSAPCTLDSPDFDLTPGYEAALSAAERRAGSYAFPVRPDGSDIGSRAPRVAAVTGPGLAAGPTAFLLGNLVARDLEALERVMASTGFEMAGRATTAVRAFRDRMDGPAVIDVIAAQTPDVVVVALTEDETGEGLDYVADLLVGGLAGCESGHIPTVVLLYERTPDARATGRLAEGFPLHVRPVRGGTPNEPMDMGSPRAVLAEVAQALRGRLFAGRVVPPAVARAPMVSQSTALEAAARQLALRQRLDIAIVSLEQSHVTVVGNQRGVSTVSHYGAGEGPGRPFHIGLQTPLDRVARWAADDPLPQALRALVLNRTSHPSAVPGTPAELQVVHAIWTTAVREALRGSPEGRNPLDDALLDLAVLTGSGVCTVARPVQAVLLLINTLEPWGITQLALDAPSGLTMIGALLENEVSLAVESSLTPLGVCVAPRGQGKAGDPALVVEAHPRAGPSIEREVSTGALDIIQWEVGVPAEVRIWPAAKFDVGLGYGRPAQLKVQIEPGVVGLIIDARGRPLTWPDDADERRARLQQWHRSIDAYPTATPAQLEAPRGD